MKQNKGHHKTGPKQRATSYEYVYGVHPVTELLQQRKRRPSTLFTTSPEPRCLAQLQPQLEKLRIPVRTVSKQELTRLCGNSDHQSMVAQTSAYVYRSKPFDPRKQPFLLLLDGVQDVRNVGAIVRSAYCTGVDGIIIPTKGTAPINPVALKASAGLAERMQILRPSTAAAAAQTVRAAGYQLLIAGFGGTPIESVKAELPICVVIGSEGFGVSPSVAQQGTIITLAQQTDEISYNASVAAGIMLYTLAKKFNTV